MAPDMFFGICPSTSRTLKFLHTYVITYGDFMVIVNPCINNKSRKKKIELEKSPNVLNFKTLEEKISVFKNCTPGI